MTRPRSDEYKEYISIVKKRDKNRCRMCESKKKLSVHHIYRWIDYPMYRYDTDKAITLCDVCHKKVNGLEEQYAPIFLSILDE